MAQLVVVYWRDIPAQVLVKAGRKSARRELPPVFMEAVDAAAMRVGAKDSEAYLAEWRRADPVEVGDDLEAEADRAVATLVADFPRERVLALAANGGLAPQA